MTGKLRLYLADDRSLNIAEIAKGKELITTLLVDPTKTADLCGGLLSISCTMTGVWRVRHNKYHDGWIELQDHELPATILIDNDEIIFTYVVQPDKK